MLAWAGDKGTLLNRGRAEGRQIMMVIQGESYLEPNPEALADLVWFFGHEISHLYQFLEDGDGAPWMVEGFADVHATHALVALGLYDQQQLERRYWAVSRECARELSGRPLLGARGRVAYVCGDLAGLAIMSMLPDGDLAEAWNQAREASDSGTINEALLYQTLRERGANPEHVAVLDKFVSQHHRDTDAAIRELLQASGLKPAYVDGSLSSMLFPFSR